MRFQSNSFEIFVPDGLPVDEALRRTTQLGIGAHQDDLEIMAAGPIVECFQNAKSWFTGVVVTDGSRSPRSGAYELFSDEQMRSVRRKEQRKAAVTGEYAALVMLDYSSNAVRDPANQKAVEDIASVLRVTRPQHVYTHNLVDKHDTHVGVAMKVIAAIRSLPSYERPQKLYGCEVWRDLDWMVDQDKVSFDLSKNENLQAALLGVFDSQISGGKRYDLASLARRRVNATYFESHGVDKVSGLSYGMDLTPLIQNPELEIESFVFAFIDRFSQDVIERLKRMRSIGEAYE